MSTFTPPGEDSTEGTSSRTTFAAGGTLVRGYVDEHGMGSSAAEGA